MENLENIALSIDADNTQLSKMEAVLQEISLSGRIVIKRAYGNWKKPELKAWEKEIMRLAIKPIQQFDYVSRKNASDMALVIDMMDLLHDGSYDAFVIVSSDSDFTPLAIRLHESGVCVIGVGEKRTPESFRNSCDDFIFLENLGNPRETQAAEIKIRPAPLESIAPSASGHAAAEKGAPEEIEEIHNLLIKAFNKNDDGSGYVYVSTAGSFLKRAKPDFAPQNYGYSKLTRLLEDFPKRYKLRRSSTKGSTIVEYKCL